MLNNIKYKNNQLWKLSKKYIKTRLGYIEKDRYIDRQKDRLRQTDSLAQEKIISLIV